MRVHVVVGSRELAAPHPPRQRRAVLDDERIPGHVVDTRGDRCIDRLVQVVVGLAGRAIDEVEVHVVEALGTRLRRGGQRAARRMHPVERGQHVRGRRLHAQRDARVARGAQLGEELR